MQPKSQLILLHGGLKLFQTVSSTSKLLLLGLFCAFLIIGTGAVRAQKKAPIKGKDTIDLRQPKPCKPVFPIKGSQKTELGHSDHMKTDITVSKDGRIDADTRTWTSEALRGFTGGVFVVLTDCDGNVQHYTSQHSYGVNGTAGGKSDRTEHWSEPIPPEKMPKIGGYLVKHVRNPQNDRWVQSLVTGMHWAAEVYREYKKAQQESDSGTNTGPYQQQQQQPPPGAGLQK